MGQCAFTHNLCAVGCPKEIRAVRRAFFFLLKKEPMAFRELVRLGPSIRPHGELLFFLMQKKPAFVPESEAFNSFIGDGFLVPELKGGSEASEDDQADNVSNEALCVIGLHGSGDKISLPARLGGGKGSPELPFCMGHAVPRTFRSGKETWLVWLLKELVG